MGRFVITAMLAAGLLVPSGVAEAQRPARLGAAHTQRRHAKGRRLAQRPTVARDPVALATSVAERYWGAEPCGGEVTLLPYSPLGPGQDSETEAWASFESSLGPDDLEAPASTYTNCAISLASWRWGTRAAIERDWNMFCLTVVHEMGHLLGYKHSSVPGSVMAPVFTDESSVPSICRSTRPRSRP